MTHTSHATAQNHPWMPFSMEEQTDWLLLQILAMGDLAGGRRSRVSPDIAGIAWHLSNRLESMRFDAHGSLRLFCAATSDARQGYVPGEWSATEHLLAFSSHHPAIRARAFLDFDELWGRYGSGNPFPKELLEALDAPLDTDSRNSRKAGWLAVQIRDLLAIASGQEPDFIPDFAGIADLLESDLSALIMTAQSAFEELCANLVACGPCPTPLADEGIQESVAFLRLVHPAVRRGLSSAAREIWQGVSGWAAPMPEILVDALAD